MDLRPYKSFVRRYWVGRGVCIAALILVGRDVAANNSWKFLLDYALLCWWFGRLIRDAPDYHFAKWVLISGQVAEGLGRGERSS